MMFWIRLFMRILTRPKVLALAGLAYYFSLDKDKKEEVRYWLEYQKGRVEELLEENLFRDLD